MWLCLKTGYPQNPLINHHVRIKICNFVGTGHFQTHPCLGCVHFCMNPWALGATLHNSLLLHVDLHLLTERIVADERPSLKTVYHLLS